MPRGIADNRIYKLPRCVPILSPIHHYRSQIPTMKRGFLLTNKAKRKLTADTDGHDPSAHKDKGKAKAET